jgi:hypothetical protein
MGTGDSTRVRECYNCVGLGNSNAVQITRKEDGFLWHCFRCDKSGFYSDTKASPKQVQEIAANANKKKREITRPTVVTLPEDFDTTIPATGLVQMYDFRITDEDIARHDIGYSRSHSRIIIPVYKYGQGPGGWAKKLVGFMGRKIDDPSGANKDKPKWYSVRQADIKHPRFISLPKTMDKNKNVVIVEDMFSAIRISSCGYLSMALLTTYLPYELYPKLRGWNVKLWLDEDAYNKSVKYQAALGNNGVTADTIYTSRDPKTYDDQEIVEGITHGRINSKRS